MPNPEIQPTGNDALDLAHFIDVRGRDSLRFVMTDDQGAESSDPVAPQGQENQSGLDAEVAEYGAGPYINTDYGWVNAGSVKGVTAIGMTSATTGNMSDVLASNIKNTNEAITKVKTTYKQVAG